MKAKENVEETTTPVPPLEVGKPAVSPVREITKKDRTKNQSPIVKQKPMTMNTGIQYPLPNPYAPGDISLDKLKQEAQSGIRQASKEENKQIEQQAEYTRYPYVNEALQKYMKWYQQQHSGGVLQKPMRPAAPENGDACAFSRDCKSRCCVQNEETKNRTCRPLATLHQNCNEAELKGGLYLSYCPCAYNTRNPLTCTQENVCRKMRSFRPISDDFETKL
ncbi:hypothetical protein B4U80_01435 [Leptotrombidium deliense]|uniref:Uncharacterized protein n=1 Tax=Leptotrombidium deliense TaxID=299467 RepID=A0A443RWT8_9ACAR|nr:hypothetical protein B4U80_01435 [Leptotrombidium deliense]